MADNIYVELVEELLIVREDERVGLGGGDDPLVRSLQGSWSLYSHAGCSS